MSSVFWVVKPNKIIFLVESTIPQKEDIILLCNGYLGTIISPHEILLTWTTRVGFDDLQNLRPEVPRNGFRVWGFRVEMVWGVWGLGLRWLRV